MRLFRKTYRLLFKKHKFVTWPVLALLMLAYGFCLPSPLFNDPACTVIEDRDGNLLGATIAKDEQWRFPPLKSVPEKFEKAILTFEDKRFYRHPGVDPLALGRAFRQNIRHGSIVSGGSTLTMQVIRLSRKGQPRNIWQKAIEMVKATRLEIRHSKKEILRLYASHAPFGGNVVGLDAAAWRYFGKTPAALSWAEASTLAVLPNSPSLIHPGKNRDQLLSKRNRLLEKLLAAGAFDEVTFNLAVEEPLPLKPIPLPRHAPHLLGRIQNEMVGNQSPTTKFKTTLQIELQRQVTQLAERRIQTLRHNEIHNLAILVLDIETGGALAYVGNGPNTGQAHGEAVDIITAPRSTGSILKPFLYCQMLQDGRLLPQELLPDVPTYINGYRPKNYFDHYDGVVPADRALSRSLNVPFIHLLQRHGVQRFHHDLQRLGLTSINRPPGNYGLTLVLGGAEGTLWEMTNAYASMARRLNHFYSNQGLSCEDDFREAIFITDQPPKCQQLVKSDKYFSADAIWLTFQAMSKLERPDSEGRWERFDSARKIAWKTGTSIGFRDAWAIGVTPKYAVGIWVGNADGEGRPGLVGVHAAAPLLFEVFEKLPATGWFDPPYDAMQQVEVCKTSGLLAQHLCPLDTIWSAANSMQADACHFHQLIHLDMTRDWQVNSSCYEAEKALAEPWFVLPPTQEMYFKKKNPGYQPMPPFLPGCTETSETAGRPLALILPKGLSEIYIPIELDGSKGRIVFEATHRNADAKIHWHLDADYVGTTVSFHSIELAPTPGKHQITLVDQHGNQLSKTFKVVENNGAE